MESIFNEKISQGITLNNPNCKIISIEGIDGSGKTTLVDNCVEELRRRGYRAEHFYTASEFNRYWNVIKKMSKFEKRVISDDVNQVLHNVAFLTYVDSILIEMQNRNDFVVTEWYLYGKMVLSDLYTGTEDSMSKRMLEEYLKNGKIKEPDYSFYLDITPEESLRRIEQRNAERESKESYDMLCRAQKIWKGYIERFGITKLNATKIPQDLTNEVVGKIILPKEIDKEDIEL